MGLKGTNAGLKWTPPGGSETTHPLPWPLKLEPSPTVKRRRVAVQPWDLSQAPTVFESSSSVELYRVRHRFEDFPRRLLRLLDHAAGGVQIDYYPDLARSTAFPLLLLDHAEEQSLDPDADRVTAGEYERDLRLRSADGTPLWPLYVPVEFTGAGEENLIRDAAMDADTDGDGVVDGFAQKDVNNGSSTPSVDGTRGAQKLSLTRGDSGYTAKVRQTALRVFGGDQVTISVALETEDGSGVAGGKIVVLWRDASGSTSGLTPSVGSVVASTGGFARESLISTAPEGAAIAEVQFRGHVNGSSGDTGTVWFRDARLLRASSDPATYANPHVSGGSQTGTSLVTSGWPVSTSGVVKAGDTIRAGGSGATQGSADAVTHFFRAAEDVGSDGSGNATIPLTVPIGSGNAPADGAALRLTHPVFG